MRVVVFLVAFCYSLPGILTQVDIYNCDLGDIHYTGGVGFEPLQYMPLSTQDQTASEKAADIMDFIQLIPNIDPFELAMLPPIGIDVSYLFLKGKVFLKNFVMSGVKQFELHKLELRMINLRSDVIIHLPLISIAGDFYLQAYLTFVPLYLKCHISADLHGLNVVATTGGKKIRSPLTGEVVLQIDSIHVDVNIQNVKVNITNIEINGPEEETGPPAMQLFSDTRRNSELSSFDKILGVGLSIVNKELLNLPFNVFEQYLTTDTY
ncbi:unnamed protein product [Spodoptera littoralis]|uniref:Uncharacterized protein n=1 Tax=Spodoptera littoralis TaxID=7109 RepID=A0A9P0IAY0_SPOLI|nr:unnamed protein product [Spodoptera littoralis]CAH1643363.1 unnamed protein product [Spodoptera littoralis]